MRKCRWMDRYGVWAGANITHNTISASLSLSLEVYAKEQMAAVACTRDNNDCAVLLMMMKMVCVQLFNQVSLALDDIPFSLTECANVSLFQSLD